MSTDAPQRVTDGEVDAALSHVFRLPLDFYKWEKLFVVPPSHRRLYCPIRPSFAYKQGVRAFRAAVAAADDSEFLIRIAERFPEESGGWRLSIRKPWAGGHFPQYSASQHELVSPNGRWAVFFSFEGWAMAGGDERFLHVLDDYFEYAPAESAEALAEDWRCAYGTSEEEIAAFLANFA